MALMMSNPSSFTDEISNLSLLLSQEPFKKFVMVVVGGVGWLRVTLVLACLVGVLVAEALPSVAETLPPGSEGSARFYKNKVNS